jgi:tripeptide aminopeptidase
MASQSLLERFLRYVQIDTQSDGSSTTIPSTEKQKDLGRLLVQELRELGVSDAELDTKGYVYATIPATLGFDNHPIIFLCAHMDTSPDASGAGIKPLVHPNYQGQDLALPDDLTVIISPSTDPALNHQIGNTLITASGLTLLGADNKAGVAEIMTVAERLTRGVEGLKHGKIRILFTPDEEVGRGADHLDVKILGADFGYTLDGEERGTLENETWNADGAKVVFEGISAHPGFAKGRLVNALKVAGAFMSSLPFSLSPEGTDGRDGFVHPVSAQGNAEQATVSLILRDFTLHGLTEQRALIRQLAEEAATFFPGAKVSCTFSEQYRNMKEVLDQHPHVVERAEAAMRRVGLTPIRQSIRGGTDGARFCFMGLPCPNLFAGEHAFHSKKEWVSLEDMELAVQVALETVRVIE